MIKIFLIFYLLLTSSLRAIEFEDIVGEWGHLKSEMFLEFSPNIDSDYWDKGIAKGYVEMISDFHVFQGTFALDCNKNKITLHYTYLKSGYSGAESKLDSICEYDIKLGFKSTGLRYMKLTSNCDKRKQIITVYKR